MRILVCNHQALFAEVLADALHTAGDDVVAITHDIDGALRVLAGGGVDVCLLDAAFPGAPMLHRLAELRRAAPRTHLVVLCDRTDPALVAAGWSAGVSAVADKGRSVCAITDLLHRVHAGRPPGTAARMVPPAADRRSTAHTDAQRLAAFLTPRERQVLAVLVRGGDTRAAARSLGVEMNTARCHIQSVLTKMGVHSRLEAATIAVRSGLVSPRTGEWLPARTAGSEAAS